MIKQNGVDKIMNEFEFGRNWNEYICDKCGKPNPIERLVCPRCGNKR